MKAAHAGQRDRSKRNHSVLFWVAIGALVIVAAIAITVKVLIHRAEPIMRHRVVQALSNHLDSRVELGNFQVSLIRGLEVSGANLAIYPNSLASSSPTLAVKAFSFRTPFRDLLRQPLEIGHVDVHGLKINVPPKAQGKQLPQGTNGNGSSSGGNGKHRKLDIVVGEMRITDAMLTLETDKPNKVPLQFDIHNLVMQHVGTGQAMPFTTTLVNPKPVGDIQSSGDFGPWNADDPISTPVSGSYSFSHADLGPLKGIGGTLSSTGRYQGELDKIVIDGETDTPNFQLDISGHPVPLHTQFHAIVDGSNGDTYLQPVKAHLLHSTFTAKGYIVRNKGVAGHDIQLTVDMDRANIQDFLKLAIRTEPPVMSGKLRMHARLEIPPGRLDVSRKMKLKGNFAVLNAYFSNPKVQSRIDELSLRGQGKPEKAKEESNNFQTARIASRMHGKFNLANGALRVNNLVYDVPGANVQLTGIYTLDGKQFDFHGTARMDATLSQMVGGWKGFLLSPIDTFFKKNGAGTQIPIKITGTESAPHFGLDF